VPLASVADGQEVTETVDADRSRSDHNRANRDVRHDLLMTTFGNLVALTTLCFIGSSVAQPSADIAQPPNEICTLQRGDCSPERASFASQADLQLVGAILRVRCGVASVGNRIETSSRCVGRMESMLAKLSKSVPAAHVNAALIEVDADRTCVDTFIPGRETADCAFFELHGHVPIAWK
jgi:hypothetical protein